MRSCGVGTGSDENAARRDAFENAKTEFTALCELSDDCRGREVSVVPERTSCETSADGGFKCYRLLIFNIGTAMASREPLPRVETEPLAAPPSPYAVARLLPKPEPKAVEPEAPTPAEAATPEPPVERRPLFVPFRPADGAKIKVGMTKSEALEQFGRPDVVRESPMNVAVFYRGRSFCHGNACMFRFERETGRVIAYQDFRVEFTDALN